MCDEQDMDLPLVDEDQTPKPAFQAHEKWVKDNRTAGNITL